MYQRLPDRFIADLLAATDIVALVKSRGIELKAAGKEFKACSPFTAERSPSFFVNPSKKMFFCFSSGKNGTAINFLMEYDRMSFMDAVRELAREAHMEIARHERGTQASASTTDRGDRGKPGAMIEVVERSRAHLRMNQRAIDYLKGLAVSGEAAKAWRLGLAPPGETLLPPAIHGAITLPVLDADRRPVGFIGHPLGGGREIAPALASFDPQRAVFGLHRPFLVPGPRPQARVLVPSAMDVVRLDQLGIRSAVATATEPADQQWVSMLEGICDLVAVLPDNRDGRVAAWRMARVAMPHLFDRRRLSFAFIPPRVSVLDHCAELGVDPFRRFLSQAQRVDKFLVEALQLKHKTASSLGSAAASLMQRIPDGMTRSAFSTHLDRALKGAVSEPAFSA